MTEEIIQKNPHKWSAALFTAIINTCKLCCISTTAKSILRLTHENSCYAFTSLAVWKLELTTILSIYGKNHPKTKLKHAAQNNKLSTLSPAEIYRMVQLNQHEWHTNTYRSQVCQECCPWCMCKVCSSLGQKWGNERAITGSKIILTSPLQWMKTNFKNSSVWRFLLSSGYAILVKIWKWLKVLNSFPLI